MGVPKNTTTPQKPRVISLFSGAGGLDLGFRRAGFEIVYANDYDKHVKETYEKNLGHPLDNRSITEVASEEVPEAEGIIGGPPCQSWSLAGTMRGISDQRGQLFYDYIRILRDKMPLFFVAENVPGMLSKTHLPEFQKIIAEFQKIGFKVTYKLLAAENYGVPQLRRRVIIVGVNDTLGRIFSFPELSHPDRPVSLREAIGDLVEPPPHPALAKNAPNPRLQVPNHEYFVGGFSYIYMSRNRRKEWDEPSYTIQASGRHAPLHPSSPPMAKVATDEWQFEGDPEKVRRLSVRECARIQTFPDDFQFYYRRLNHGYKMIGNAVPVRLAQAVAEKIKLDLFSPSS